MKKPKFANGEIYHIYNRGVNKNNVFFDNNDYLRFIYSMFEMNDTKPVERFYTPISEVKPPKIKENPFVDILVFVLMPNHYHFILRQKIDNGISLFMQKIGTGYTMYINQKYERVGSLFQGTYKAIHIANESYLLYLPYYIHLNPMDLIEPNWKTGKINNLSKAIKFLESYRWSSYLDYIGQKNFPSVINKNILINDNNPENYKKEIINWLKELSEEDITNTVESIKEITLE